MPRVARHSDPIPARLWDESVGDALWWRFPVTEPPYVGTPLDDDFPEYATHFTRFEVPEDPRLVGGQQVGAMSDHELLFRLATKILAGSSAAEPDADGVASRLCQIANRLVKP